MKQRKPKKMQSVRLLVCAVPLISESLLWSVRTGTGQKRKGDSFSKRAGRQAESAQEGLTAPQLLD